jgi:hypothetical protein
MACWSIDVGATVNHRTGMLHPNQSQPKEPERGSSFGRAKGGFELILRLRCFDPAEYLKRATTALKLSDQLID